MSSNTAPERSFPSVSILQHPVVKQSAVAAAQAVLILAAMFVFLDGRHRDIRVPFHFTFDSLTALMQCKSTLDNGWWWFNPMIGAPFGLDELAFPANSNVDQALIWIVGRVVHSAITASNLTWILMVVLSGLSATWCLRRLGGSTIAAVVCGTLYAVTPYALYRNIAHIWMVIYLLPFACTLALLLATGRLQGIADWRNPGTLLLVGGAVLIGFNYVYYAFFAAFFIAIGAAIGYFLRRDGRVLRTGAICLALVCAATVLNLAPSLYSWKRHGKPIVIILSEKSPAHAEIFGLKVRHLVSPVIQHTMGPLGWWTGKEALANFPLENENRTGRLGLVGTAGFLVLIAVLFVPGLRERSPSFHLLHTASLLTVAAVLLGTVGGFGSVFNLLVSPDIRAYNRIAPFIAFFSLAAVMVLLDSAFRSRGAAMAAAGVVLAVGLADQGVAATDLNVTYPAIAAEMPPLRDFVGTLERRLPDRAMVLQLPFRTYLNEAAVARMQPYDHLKLYLVAHRLRWSYPALSNQQSRWQMAASRLGPGRLARQVAAEGFAAIVVDRFGYEDNGVAVTAAIGAELSPRDVVASTDRYIAYDIRALAQDGVGSDPPLTAEPVAATAGMNTCPEEATVSIDRIDTETAPFASRTVGVTLVDGVHVMGWAVDAKRALPASAVDVAIDEVPFPALYGSDRPDVAEYFHRQAYFTTGFAVEIPGGSVSAGPHVLTVRVVSADRACYFKGPTISIAAR
jgi:phosphoglycerol transferase